MQTARALAPRAPTTMHCNLKHPEVHDATARSACIANCLGTDWNPTAGPVCGGRRNGRATSGRCAHLPTLCMCFFGSTGGVGQGGACGGRWGVVAHLSAGALWLRTLQLPLCKCRRLVRCMGPVQQPSWQSCTGPLARSLCNCLFANLAGWFVVSGLPATVCLREQISLRVCRELGNRLQPPWLLLPATIPLAGHHSCLHGGVHSLRGLQ
jgi:hypothetical protein